MLALRLVMRPRLLEALDLENGLVEDAEGEVAHIAAHPLGQDAVDAAMASGTGLVYLRQG